MDRYIINDLLKYVISDYVCYPYISYCQNLICNEKRIVTTNHNNFITKEIDKIIVCSIKNNVDTNETTTRTYTGDIIAIITTLNGHTIHLTKYKDKQIHGYKIEYSNIAPHQLICKQHYSYGKLNGKSIQYAGKYCTIQNYLHSKSHGLYQKYCNDILIIEKNMKFGLEVDVSKEYNEHDGELQRIINYTSQGVKNGYSLQYNISGKLINISYYCNGIQYINLDGYYKDMLPDKTTLLQYINEMYE
jgi:hypothetical protein